MVLYQNIADGSKKKLALLIDPDKFGSGDAAAIAERAGVDYLFVGGSFISEGNFHDCVKKLKKASRLPLIIFPGNTDQVDTAADAILFLSLISGRNADSLIGRHVIAAPALKRTSLEIIPTGYMLIDGGKITSALYMSNTLPIPADKPDIAASTAIAGEMLGLKMIYMDTGSGAPNHVPCEMIKEVKKNISIPLIVGGGIRTPEDAAEICAAGADLIVLGTVAEKSPETLIEIAKSLNSNHAKN